MTIVIYALVFCSIALILGGLMLIIRSAKKFNLSKEQLEKIKKREKEQRNKDDL